MLNGEKGLQITLRPLQEKPKSAGDQHRYGRTLIYQASLNLVPGSVDQALDLLVEARRIFGALDHHYYLATVAVYMGKAYLISRTYEYDVYDLLNYCVETGIKEARMFSRIPYYRQLSELRVLQARLVSSRSDCDYKACAKHFADALADAVLFNRFQCEKIADQIVETIADEAVFETDFHRLGRSLQSAFHERMEQVKKGSRNFKRPKKAYTKC